MNVLGPIAAAVLAAAFFALAELAIVSVGRLRLRQWVRDAIESGDPDAGDAIERPYRLQSPILVGHALALVAAATLVAGALAGSDRAPLATAALATLALGPPLYLLGEIVPRAMARARGPQLLPAVMVVLRVCAIVFRPLTLAADRLTAWVLEWTGAPRVESVETRRRGLERLLSDSERVGVVESGEREIIAGVFEFGRTPASAVMTPVERMTMAPAGAPAERIAALMRTTGYSRIPLRREGTDRIVGMVHVFDVLKLPPGARPWPRQVVTTDPGTPCDRLLLEMKRRRCHLAVVSDGERTLGMVTMEDLVEELVGEIRDEHDRGREPGPGRAAFVVDAHLPIAEINEKYGTDLPVGGAETVAGFVVARLGRIPRPGDEMAWRDWVIDVLDATPTRVRRVRFRRRPRGAGR